MTIDISNIDKAELLAGLFNASKPLGLGFLAKGHNIKMSIDSAREILKDSNGYFDYLQGRVMKVDISGDNLDPYLYDRDNGSGAALQVVESVRRKSGIHFNTSAPTTITEKLAESGKNQEAVSSAKLNISTF